MKPDKMTLAELHGELHRAPGHFFYDKFKNLSKLTPEKRKFMVKVLKLLIEHSYLGAEMKRMAGHASMPESVKQMLREWDKRFPGRIETMFRSLGNVVPSHLLDARLFDFAGLRATGTPDAEGDIAFDAPPLGSDLSQPVGFQARD